MFEMLELNLNIPHRRSDVFFKRLLVLVVQLLGVIMRGLLRTHVVDGSIKKIKENNNHNYKTNICDPNQNTDQLRCIETGIKKGNTVKDTCRASYSPQS